MTDHPSVQILLDLGDPASQTIGVELHWTPATLCQRWQMPVWTPGSYTVRDPAQHLHTLELSQGGETLNPRRMSPSRWQVELSVLEPLCLRYQLEARQLTVRTNHLDPDFASLCLSAVVMEVEGHRWSSHALELQLPDHWHGFVPLPERKRGYWAENFDQLVDSPVHAGPFQDIPFQVQGCRHSLVLIGSPPMGWPETLVDDIASVCTATAGLMGTQPPAGDRYQLVIQLLDSGYGGLEHDNSSVLQFSWPLLAKPEGYRQLLQLVGHEYLHQWNVRRLRPREYRPYDHGRAVISDGLWFAEGVTSYFDLALPLLAGRSDRHTLLKDLAKDLSHVLLHPGRKIQSLADSSREAWIRLYKSTPAGADTQISYYKLGTALAFCLDVELRCVGTSLAQLLRNLWEQFGQTGRGYSRLDLVGALGKLNPELAEQLPSWLDHCDALPIETCIQKLGLNLVPVHGDSGWTGLTVAEDGHAVRVKRVREGSPAHAAGLVAGDEIVAVRRHRLTCLENWTPLLKGAKTTPITYARRGLLEETQLIQQSSCVEEMTLEWNTQADLNSRELRDRWFEIV